MRRLSPDRGNVAIVVALFMTTLLGVGAIVIDAGALFVTRSALQTGADAAAIAIAKACADHAVDPVASPTTCSSATAQSLADQYLDANTVGAATVMPPQLDVSYGGDAGRVTVRGDITENTIFANFLDIATQNVAAVATARWGPLTAEDDVFPLAVCKGALPDPDTGEVVLEIEPSVPPGTCDDAPDAMPFGWIPPFDATTCTALVTLLPSSYLDVSAPDLPPTEPACDERIEELKRDIAGTHYCHTTWWRGYHCHEIDNPPEERRRVLAVYDAAAGAPTGRPSHALVAFEFTGVRFGPDPADEAHRPSTTEACDSGSFCIRGYVRDWIPPTDGPIADPALLGLPGIDDTTVLDVRLED